MKKQMALLLAVCVFLGLAGCQRGEVLPHPNGAFAIADGRQTGGLQDGKIGDRMENVFFAYTVTRVEKFNEYGGHTASKGMKLVVADLTVEGVFDGSVPMYSGDFRIRWNGGDANGCLSLENYTDGMMQDEYELAKGKTAGGKLVYEVPADSSDYSIVYTEVYEDEIEGNTYSVSFSL